MPAFALRATARQPSLASPSSARLACRAVAREASEGWRTGWDSNPRWPYGTGLKVLAPRRWSDRSADRFAVAAYAAAHEECSFSILVHPSGIEPASFAYR